MDEPVRINVRIPADVNEWLDKESKRTAVPKSSLVYMMIDKYIAEKAAVSTLKHLPSYLEMAENTKNTEK